MKYKINDCNYDIKRFIKEDICPEFNLDYWDEWIEEQDYDSLKNTPNILVSVEDNNELIGVGAVKIINKEECYFNTFYVKKEYRNMGIGSKIFNICMEYILENGYKKITLNLDPKFEIAKRMYEKNGFVLDCYNEENQELNYYKYV